MSQFHLGWFISFRPTVWNNPISDGRDSSEWTDGQFYIDMARSLERAGFDYMMFEDSSMVSDIHGGTMEADLKHRTRLRARTLVGQFPGHAQHRARYRHVGGAVRRAPRLTVDGAQRHHTGPGAGRDVVMTPLGRKAWSNPKGDALRARIPVGRFAETHDVTSVAVFLASPGAAMINGADILVDGGYTIL